MSKTQKITDPIAAINAEADKARRSADKIGIMSIKSANQWVDDALEEPDPKRYFYDLLVEGECTVIIAASNTGKSIFTTQMAEAVARENIVLYLDCELSSKQFQMRYVEGTVSPIIHRFPDTLLRAEIRPDDIVDTNLEDALGHLKKLPAGSPGESPAGIPLVFLYNHRADRPDRALLFARHFIPQYPGVPVYLSGEGASLAGRMFRKAGAGDVRVLGKQDVTDLNIPGLLPGTLIAGIGNIKGPAFDLILKLEQTKGNREDE